MNELRDLEIKLEDIIQMKQEEVKKYQEKNRKFEAVIQEKEQYLKNEE